MILGVMAIAASNVQAQTMDLFRNDPVGYFGGKHASSWVGTGMYFQTNYSDTLQFSPDSTGQGLTIRRVLVNADKGVVISRGAGHLLPATGGSAYKLRWNEKSYPPVDGVMRWEDGQWVISFDGEWKDWSIRIRQDEPGNLIAAAARMIPGFRPIELASFAYQATSR